MYCPKCGVFVRKKNFRRHVNSCGGYPGGYPIKHLQLSQSGYFQVQKAKKKKQQKLAKKNR